MQYVDRTGRERVDAFGNGRRRLLLDLGQATTQHHGGQLQFGPDGFLYVSTGMGDDPATSQDPSAHGGKILRVDPRGGAPTEVYAIGLRNPWRFSFVRARMLIGDVGEAHAEEVDVIAAGARPAANFGWPGYEGRARARGAGRPGRDGAALTYSHRGGRCAITGGYVVRGRLAPVRPLPLRRPVHGPDLERRLAEGRLGRRAALRPRGALPRVASGGRAGRLYGVSFDGRRLPATGSS